MLDQSTLNGLSVFLLPASTVVLSLYVMLTHVVQHLFFLRQVAEVEGSKRQAARVETRGAASGRKYGLDHAFKVTVATAAVAGHGCRHQCA